MLASINPLFALSLNLSIYNNKILTDRSITFVKNKWFLQSALHKNVS
ncbi:hypothetical protein NT05LI_2977 [Listeria ivanovii FSL F6-596]|nr:hypothetical protein NT05LI_2977 [Listeria ivanovii FSL F6-596]